MDYFKRSYWITALRLRLYECFGNAFQDFFADIMEKAYDSVYVRVRSYGQLGDKGCDGYRSDTAAVHQCYAPMQPATQSVATIVAKMRDDFTTAKSHLGPIMQSWLFTHNIMNGLHPDIILELQKLKNENPHIDLAFFGPPSIEQLILSLDEAKIEDLLGPAASNVDYSSPNVADISAMLEAIASKDMRPPADAIKPVPLEKIEYNRLSKACAQLISMGMLNEPFVEEYIKNSPDPTLGDRIARTMRDKYESLRDERLSPDDIYAMLFSFVLGDKRVKTVIPAEQVVAQAILSFFFHACDVFEDQPIQGDAI